MWLKGYSRNKAIFSRNQLVSLATYLLTSSEISTVSDLEGSGCSHTHLYLTDNWCRYSPRLRCQKWLRNFFWYSYRRLVVPPFAETSSAMSGKLNADLPSARWVCLVQHEAGPCAHSVWSLWPLDAPYGKIIGCFIPSDRSKYCNLPFTCSNRSLLSK